MAGHQVLGGKNYKKFKQILFLRSKQPYASMVFEEFLFNHFFEKNFLVQRKLMTKSTNAPVQKPRDLGNLKFLLNYSKIDPTPF